MSEENNTVRRWLVQVDEYRWLLYDDEDDIEDWDTILEVRLPREMALMLDYTQHSYFQMQGYFEAQWESMQRKLKADEPEYLEGDGDEITFQRQFDSIVKENGLDDILGEGEEE